MLEAENWTNITIFKGFIAELLRFYMWTNVAISYSEGQKIRLSGSG